ncbi:rRNA biogenesis protein RRP5 [Asparagus officinalis]|uniref:rRNA biogenesis protein RRP5 n=1 Tax=Asparagus officinalis TaxID=4686 RepID=UPI00098E7253|nr:rRNA biogenesis protein RRP5 [Asparagus officinalis]
MAAHGEKKKKSQKQNPNHLAPKSQKPFKRSKKEKIPKEPASTDSLSTSLLVQDDDPEFPRGGGSVLSRKEEAEARAEAEAEFEKEKKEFRKGKDRRKKKNERKKPAKGADDELGSLFGEGVTGRLPKFANRITLKNISPNMKLWGVIVEVNQKDLVIGLPGGLRGFVRTEDVSDIVLDNVDKDTETYILPSIFHVGQLVSCIVLTVDDDKREGSGQKRIWLSLHLSLLYKGLTLDAVQDGMVLTAQVKSVEDHGYILHFGVPLFTGFLPRSGQGGGKFLKGQLLQCAVKSVDKVRTVVYLNADPDLVSKYVAKDLKGISIDLLVPGMMVNARIHSILENGIMLCFLTYFTGTVCFFEYDQNKKVNARILFIDPSSRAIGLTLNSYHIQNKVPPSHVKTGDIYDNSRILRVDRGIGLLLEIPSSPKPTPAYVNIFDVADEEGLKLEKKFREGSEVRVRVTGIKHLEGLAMGTLKGSAFEGSVFTHSDVKPGMLLKAKVIAVENFGAIVQFASGIKALCPLPHMSELDIMKPPKKFKVGAELPFRVLGCKSKRITVTHKKTLVKSKLNILASYADATEGLITHGWITKIEKHGCFVKFYNGVQGFAHRSELALDPGSEADAVYHVGQVVKCRIISSVVASHNINLSFVTSPKRVCQDDVTKIGSVVSGIVERLTASGVILHVDNAVYMKGMIPDEHLTDHRGQAMMFKSLLRPGYKFDQLLVLDIEGQNLVLSAKYSLLCSLQEIPSEVSQIRPLSVLHGYICNVIEAGCFVRFLGRLTGFSPKYKVADEKIDNLLDAFSVGQSVRSYILNVNSETGRIKLSLKQSLCFSTDVSFIQSYFLMEEKIAKLQFSDAKISDLRWLESFNIGAVVEGEVQEMKEFGSVLSFKDHPDIVGFIANQHLGGSQLEKGSVVKAFVLDIAKSEGLVDLSLKTELVDRANIGASKNLSSKKKRRRDRSTDLELQQTVNTIVEIVKENYLVLSIPEHNYAIGYASLLDYNTQKLSPRHFHYGQSVVATVGEVPSPDSLGRLLLLLKCTTEVLKTSSSKRTKKAPNYVVGSLVDAEVIDIKPLELVVKFGTGLHGRVHITEVAEDGHSLDNMLSKFRIGQLVNARIVSKAQSGKKGKGYEWELSLRPSVLSGSAQMISGEFNFSVGNIVSGYVSKVDNEWVWLTVSRNVRAHIYILDSSSEPSELQEFGKLYTVGRAVEGRIIGMHKEKRLLRLCPSISSLADRGSSAKEIEESNVSDATGLEHIMQGDLIGGRIKKVLPGVGGLLVQIGPHRHGRVHYTELLDTWASNPLSRYEEGQFVKCKVLEISRSSDGLLHVDLSLRTSLMGINSTIGSDSMDSILERFENIEDLHPNMEVKGYVKNVTTKGCFIMLSRRIDARVLLSNLSDDYIDTPEKEFPVGLLVHGRVLSVDSSSKRVDVTLKKDTESQRVKSDTSSFLNVKVGDVISGLIRRTEPYGLFIKIDNTSMVGLCHISEVSDEHLDKIEGKYQAGERVVAKVLKVDEERRRISLGMKKSYIGDTNHGQTVSGHSENDKTADDPVVMYDSLPTMQQNDDSPLIQEIFNCEDDPAVLSQVQTRASVLPLQVSLDQSDSSDMEDASEKQDSIGQNNLVVKRSDRRERKKAKEERELEITAAEERILQKDIPRTEEDFEKLVRSSPNSSFVWVQYMAFMESLADVEKARSIAERALRTINFREENEKLNIWTAYFNLENQYGNPPKESVRKIFQRALQYCDPKKVHFALLGMYERTEQHDLAEDLLERMAKKFKTSCKIWLHRVQNLLKQGKEGIQSIVNRALLSLPRKKHIKFISQTAILEFKCGLPDRGRSMFEGVLREYPKRTDLWSIYLDQEIRLGDPDVIRALFERVTCLSLPPRKIEFLFKKYLNYEKSQGDEERIEHVKRKAIEYAESLK